MVWVESGRELMEDMVLVRSEGGTIVDAMDMVRDWLGTWFGIILP